MIIMCIIIMNNIYTIIMIEISLDVISVISVNNVTTIIICILSLIVTLLSSLT